MTIKDVEAQVGITKKNIRFYERMNLLSPVRDRENRYRNYSQQDVIRLKKVKLLRSLYVPIEEIRSVLNGDEEIKHCVHQHSAQLLCEIEHLRCAQLLCTEIDKSVENGSELDIDEYLNKLRSYEKEGVRFMNVKKTDTKKQYIVPIICAFVMLVFMIGFIVLFLWLTTLEEKPPLVFSIIFLAIPASVSVGVIIALTQRIREIKGGEINEARKY